MTEYNIFCYSKKHNDQDSFQQERYRAFNVVVGEKRFFEIVNAVNGTLGKNKNLRDITQDQFSKLLLIPEAKDFKDGFEFIAGLKIETVEEMTMAEVCEALGKTIKIKK